MSELKKDDKMWDDIDIENDIEEAFKEIEEGWDTDSNFEKIKKRGKLMRDNETATIKKTPTRRIR